MGVRDRLERVAAWFGFGVDDDDYYEDEDEEERRYGKDHYANGANSGEPSPAVRRLGRAERSSAFGTSLGDLFGSEGPSRRESYAQQNQPPHLRAVPDQRPTRVSVLEPSSFNDAQSLADRFKRQQPVILNLQNVDGDLSRRMVDFCSGLTYALDGNIQSVANRVFLLTPRDVEVSAEERKRLAESGGFDLGASDIHSEQLRQYESAGVRTTSSNRELAEASDLVIAAVKPWDVAQVMEEISPSFTDDSKAVTSVAAGVSIERISESLPQGTAILRVMPNVCASVGLGSAVVTANEAGRCEGGHTAGRRAQARDSYHRRDGGAVEGAERPPGARRGDDARRHDGGGVRRDGEGRVCGGGLRRDRGGDREGAEARRMIVALLQQFGFSVASLLAAVVNYTFWILLAVIFASILFSWFPGYPSSSFMQPVYDAVKAVTNPILWPIRSRVPMVQLGGFGIDLSPIIAILGLYIARSLLFIVIEQFIQPVTGC